MTYDQLAAFVAVADAGAFTAASKRLHKSQPAVSKLVRNLEQELGVALFDRRAYRATLTSAGRRFRERAARVLEQTDGLKSFAIELSGAVEPVVRLALEAVTPLAPVMRALRAVGRRHPAVRFELTTERLAGAIEALRADRADLAIATKLGAGATRLESGRFARVRVIPVAHREHALARQRKPIPAEALRAHAQIVLRDSSAEPDSPSVYVLEGGLHWSVTDVAAKKEVILAGMGWGGLPDHVAADAIAAGELVALRIPEFDASPMELFALRRRDRAHGVVAQALWRAILGR
ncbi:MAG TPA: LysR family transcriptional regulator [Myxococcota bacterium]|nr:LysR family transcriptional regulator [Myxococcota bacterium]